MADNEKGIFGKRTRYSIKESYVKDAQGIIRNSLHELNPNVVRIEPLGPAARQAFLGPVHAAADALKLRIAYAMNPDAFKPFYGILTPNDLKALTISFNSNWKNENPKESFERAVEILKSPAVAMPLGANVGETIGEAFGGHNATGFGFGTAAGAITSFISNETSKGKSFVDKVASFVGSVGDTLGSSMETFGMESTSTGASTLKKYGGASMEIPAKLTFTWYMPEQEDLFRLSIHRLLQLAYVRKAYTTKSDFYDNLKAATNSGMQQSFINAKNLKDSLSGVATAWVDAGEAVLNVAESNVMEIPGLRQLVETNNGQAGDGVVDAAGTGVSIGNTIAKYISDMAKSLGDTFDNNAKEMQENGRFSDANKQNLVDGMNVVITKVLEAYMEGSNFMGANFVLVPNPVRLTIGNILDVEPMVIENVNITPSEELFINSIGASIPVTMKVTVTLKPWMTPGPNHDFIHLIGDNLFYPIPQKDSDKAKK
ncbi:MAG: hypothetical protein IKN15_02280 [Bacteroidaceae bacterium]|nr:hypothetical protein [Bacteroidaceae bacterium]